MTTPDVQKRLQDIAKRARTRRVGGFIVDKIDDVLDLLADLAEAIAEQPALAALDGEREEEWRAVTQLGDEWRVQDDNTAQFIAHGLTRAHARRIARLPRLERAAREVLRSADADADVNGNAKVLFTRLITLRAALSDGGSDD